MANYKIYNIGKANEEISAADAVIDAALATAKITTINVDNKPVPASSAPLAAKISALLAVNPPGVGSQQISDVLVSNDAIAKQLEKANEDLAVANASVASLTQENARLKGELVTAQGSVATLTAANAELKNRLDAAINQYSAAQKQIGEINSQLSRLCVAAGCLDLAGEDGKALKADADEATKLAAADKVSIADKLKAYHGAVNAAVAKTGISFGLLPAALPQQTPGAPKKSELTGRARMRASMKIEGHSFSRND